MGSVSPKGKRWMDCILSGKTKSLNAALEIEFSDTYPITVYSVMELVFVLTFRFAIRFTCNPEPAETTHSKSHRHKRSTLMI